MSNPELLTTYLHDHHAGSHGALELLERIQDNNKGSVFAERASEIADEINGEVRMLEDVMAALDSTPSKTKDAAAWLTEKLARLKLNGRVVDYSPLSRLIEFEALVLGINGKRRLWHTLKIAQQSDQRLSGFDFDEMIELAKDQLQRVESLHDQAAEIAFVEAGQS